MLEGLAFHITLKDYKCTGDYRKVSAIQVIDVYLEDIQNKTK